MKNKIIYLIAMNLLFFASAFAQQEQLTKRFSIAFSNESLISVLLKLTKAQGHLAFGRVDELKSNSVTLNLQNVTLTEALDKILTTQNIYKDYFLTNYGNFIKIDLKEEKIFGSHYFDRQKNKTKFYHIGDKLPDSAYAIDNYIEKTVKISAFKNKLVILDFWNINCSGCISAMPKMESLQHEFKDQIKIILVTKDSREQVGNLKKHVKIVRETGLASITGECLLGSLFDYNYVPMQVWIDQSGVIKYITSSNISNEQNIREFLAGKRMNLHEVKDTVFSINNETPLSIVLHPIANGNFGVSSYLAPYNNTRYFYGIGSSGFTDTATIKSLTVCRQDIYDLYKQAYYGFASMGSPKINILVDPKYAKQYRPDDITWDNFYDYQLITRRKNISTKQFYHLMQQELDAYFNIKSTSGKRKLTCYVITRINSKINSQQMGDNADNHPSVVNNVLTADSAMWNSVLDRINLQRYYDRAIPFIDETGIGGRTLVSLTMNIDFDNNLAAVQKSLAPYGLSIKKENRLMNCIVLNDAQ